MASVVAGELSVAVLLDDDTETWKTNACDGSTCNLT